MAYRIKTSDGSLLAEEPDVAMKAFEVVVERAYTSKFRIHWRYIERAQEILKLGR